MSSKKASVHLRCDDSKEVLAKLKKRFDGKGKGPDPGDLMALELIKAFAYKNINGIANPAEKAEKEAALASIVGQVYRDMGDGGRATIVVRQHFVSLYWFDHIRSENLRCETAEYAACCGVPALGVAQYDDGNFQIYAVRDPGKPTAALCGGEYFFDYEDITPVNAEDICAVIDAPFLLEGLSKALACEDGELMSAVFEMETGLTLFAGEEECAANGIKKWYEWERAVVFAVKE